MYSCVRSFNIFVINSAKDKFDINTSILLNCPGLNTFTFAGCTDSSPLVPSLFCYNVSEHKSLMRLYICIFYIYCPYQKYLSCEDWIKKNYMIEIPEM